METWEGLKSRGGLCCSKEPGSVLLRWVSGVGVSSDLLKFVLAHFPGIWLQQSKEDKGKIHLDLIRAALTSPKGSSGCLV